MREKFKQRGTQTVRNHLTFLFETTSKFLFETLSSIEIMSNDAKNNDDNTTVDDVLLKKGMIAGRIMTDSNATKDQKIRAGKSLSESFLANKQVDSPSSSSCSSGVDWSQVVQLSSAIAEKTTKL